MRWYFITALLSFAAGMVFSLWFHAATLEEKEEQQTVCSCLIQCPKW